MADYWSRIDAVLMGRKTWEFAAKAGGSAGGETSGVRTYVFSRTMAAAPPGATLVRDDAGAFVRDLKRKDGKEICVMGGGELAQSLFAAGVIDEVGLNIHPILLGSGVPFFRDAGRIRLKLLENRTIDGGCVLATFKVVQARRSR
jgi:dihydrofolate reductase